MTKTMFLSELKTFTEDSISELIMPLAPQKDDTEQGYRKANVYLMRIPSGTSATKKVPYILHQITGGTDSQPEGKPVHSTAVVRTLFCVYDEDEEAGGLALLELMERLRIDLLKNVVIGKQFILDVGAGIESTVYPDDTAPYYIGEMTTTWIIPSVQRELPEYKELLNFIGGM